jgi:hypothetical protein
MDCLSLDVEILMCEECKLYPHECGKGEHDVWTLTNGMEMVPCEPHRKELENEDHEEG